MICIGFDPFARRTDSAITSRLDNCQRRTNFEFHIDGKIPIVLGAIRRLKEAEMKLIRWMIVLGAFSAQNYVFAQDAKIVEAAKKEGGKVVIYGSLETPVVEGVIQAFRKKTGITAEYWRA